MKSASLTDAQIRVQGWKALVARLGPSGALRFAMLTEAGSGDYSETRHHLLGSLPVDELIARTRASRPHGRRR